MQARSGGTTSVHGAYVGEQAGGVQTPGAGWTDSQHEPGSSVLGEAWFQRRDNQATVVQRGAPVDRAVHHQEGPRRPHQHQDGVQPGCQQNLLIGWIQRAGMGAAHPQHGQGGVFPGGVGVLAEGVLGFPHQYQQTSLHPWEDRNDGESKAPPWSTTP